MKPKHLLLSLFLSFMKIGAFTFGGGYAMIALLRAEFVDRRGYLTADEFADMVAISESTPGPIAINAATYIGYRMAGVGGALLSTIGVALPSFVIIYLVSLFFDAFLALEWVGYAFRGIRVCVAYLILSAGIRMIRELKKSPLTLVLLLLTLGVCVMFSLFAVSFSSIFYILIGAAVGLCVYLCSRLARRNGKDGDPS